MYRWDNSFIFQSTKNYINAYHKTEWPNLTKDKKDCTSKSLFYCYCTTILLERLYCSIRLELKKVQTNMYALRSKKIDKNKLISGQSLATKLVVVLDYNLTQYLFSEGEFW